MLCVIVPQNIISNVNVKLQVSVDRLSSRMHLWIHDVHPTPQIKNQKNPLQIGNAINKKKLVVEIYFRLKKGSDFVLYPLLMYTLFRNSNFK